MSEENNNINLTNENDTGSIDLTNENDTGSIDVTKENDTFTIRLGKLPGDLKTYEIPIGTTLNESLKIAKDISGISYQGYEVRLNGQESPLDTVLKAGAVITLIRPISGNES